MIRILPLAAAITAFAAIAIAPAAIAAEPTAAQQAKAQTEAIVQQDLSAASKKRRAQVEVYREHYAAPYAYRGHPYDPRPNFAPDPSLVPHPYRDGLDWARSTGRCVKDLGYGRFEYCGW